MAPFFRASGVPQAMNTFSRFIYGHQPLWQLLRRSRVTPVGSIYQRVFYGPARYSTSNGR